MSSTSDPTPTLPPDDANSDSENRPVEQSTGGAFRRIAGTLLELSRATFDEGKRQKDLFAVRSELKDARVRLDERIPRDVGALAIQAGIEIDSEAEIISELKQRQKTFEVANQAGIAGDKEKEQEARDIAKSMTALQVTLGKAVLDQQPELDGLAPLIEKRDSLVEQIATAEETERLLTEAGQQRSSRGKAFSLVGFSLVAVVALAGSYLLFSTLFGSPAYVNSSKDEKALEDALGLVVCGLRIVDSSGKLIELPKSTGTAFAVSPDGFLLTNKHVVEEIVELSRTDLWKEELRNSSQLEVEERVWVFVGGKKLDAEIIHVSGSFDLAILKVDHVFSRPFRLSSESNLARDTDIRALGFPGAASTGYSEQENVAALARANADATDLTKQFKSRDFDFVLTSGTVSLCSVEEGADRHWIQHNAEINPGNSGGPLIATDGTVVGINTQYVEGAKGVFRSFSLPQIRSEIQEHVNKVTWD
ncbi:MAG: serine protease [Planctomycetota bacterium]|nr:serine protease [Planctomycetota bacterium]MDA1251201.1 serine protease [Planctomycetota bacterium]